MFIGVKLDADSESEIKKGVNGVRCLKIENTIKKNRA